jgi:hypothetical protein
VRQSSRFPENLTIIGRSGYDRPRPIFSFYALILSIRRIKTDH